MVYVKFMPIKLKPPEFNRQSGLLSHQCTIAACPFAQTGSAGSLLRFIADSKSGVSGAGRSLALATHFCEVNDSFKAYKVAVHRHNPEMNAVLSREAAQAGLHYVCAAPGSNDTRHADDDICNTGLGFDETGYHRYVTEKPIISVTFIRFCPEDRLPDTLHVRGTNFCDIGFQFG